MKPASIRIRTYQVGFGDCFLVSFRYGAADERHVLVDFGSTSPPPGAAKDHMDKVAANIAERCAGRLTAVVATHRHKDHVSGFAVDKTGAGPGRIIAGLKPRLVIQPWTENPKLAPDATRPVRSGGKRQPSAATRAASLSAMQQVAGQLMEEAGRVRYLPAAVKREFDFLGDDNIGNAAAVRNLMTMARNEYVHAGQRSRLEELLPGVEVHVLGPPTVAQTETIKKQRSRDPDEFWHLQLAAGETLQLAPRGQVRPLFPDHLRPRTRREFPIEARWLIHHARRIRGEQMLSIVRMLDKAMNNTSLILLFRIGGKSLLFPGDAQIENWAYALEEPAICDMLKTVDVYKVGHHGSLNATPKSLWELFERKSEDAAAPERLTSLMSTMAGKHGSVERRTEVPRRTLTKDLERHSRLISTESFAAGAYFDDVELAL